MATVLHELRNGSDIRGIALEGVAGQEVNLTPEAVSALGRGFARWLGARRGKGIGELVVCVGRDSRLSGPKLAGTLADALSGCGVRVLDAGLATTPAMFMSCVFDDYSADGAVMITASHLPWNRNGLKFFTPDGGVESSDIVAIVDLAEEGEPFASEGAVRIEEVTLMDAYAAHLRGIIVGELGKDKPLAGLKVVVDAGNGSGGFYAHDVLAPLGADVSASQFLEPDGHFPNHIPNPENAEAMASITAAVRASGADLGIIFDTDVDRSSAVDEQAAEINRDAIVALAATFAAKAHPGTTVVTDSVTTDELTDFLEGEFGLKHFRYRRGYRNVINKMTELNAAGTDCALAIETSGHAAYLDNYSLDDGAYLATLIVCAAARLKREGKGLSELVSTLKRPAEEREVRMRILEKDFRPLGEGVLSDFEAWARTKAGSVASEAAGAQVEVAVVEPSYEGVRLSFTGALRGWALLRMSLHEPILPLNLCSSDAGGIATIETTLRSFFTETEGVDSTAL